MRPLREREPEERAEAKERTGRVAEAVNGLTNRERRMLTMYYWHEASLKEAGAALGVSESRAHQILQAALESLRNRL